MKRNKNSARIYIFKSLIYSNIDRLLLTKYMAQNVRDKEICFYLIGYSHFSEINDEVCIWKY